MVERYNIVFNRKNKKEILFKCYLILATFFMLGLDNLAYFGYFTRAFLKIFIFGIVPFAYLKINELNLPNLERDKSFIYILYFCVFLIFFGLTVGFCLFKLGFLGSVKYGLDNNLGVNRGNYFFVYLYIIFLNGPLEEFFFRYVNINIFENKLKYFISSFLFAIYHLGMLKSMFDFKTFLLMIIGLVAVGYFFIRINKKDSIINSIVIHMAANFSINTVGLFLIYEIF